MNNLEIFNARANMTADSEEHVEPQFTVGLYLRLSEDRTKRAS